MEQNNTNQSKNKIFTILKWIFAVLFLFSVLGSLMDKAFISAIIFLLIGLLLLPPLTEFWRSKFSFLSNKLIKGGLLFVLFIVGISTNPNISKNSSKKENNSEVMNIDDKEDILVDYIKKNKTTDKSLLNISKLGEIGEMFNNGNYSTIHPHDGYITEQTDSVNKKKILVFNPRFDFDERSTYLKNDAKNGTLKDYIINFELDTKGKIISKKTILTYSKTGKVEYENSEVPEFNTFINADIVENQKLNKEAEKLVAQQKEEYEKRKAEFEEKCLSSWDGSNRELVRIVKESMNDPDSFEHVETLYKLYKDYAVVIMKFRGNNAFGGKVLNSVTAKVNIEDGSVISVEN